MNKEIMRVLRVGLALLILSALWLAPTGLQAVQAAVLTNYSTVGDTVWVDEDGDGDVDAGEPGIPNVRLTLTGKDMNNVDVSRVTYTDTNGQYIFKSVLRSNSAGYTVAVDTSTLPAGLALNQTYDEDGTGTPNASNVRLEPDVEYVTADFGYNWAAPAETNTPTGTSTGMIGDRVWSDADGDGRQDPGEPGLYNVPVALVTVGPDGLFGTADDVTAASTTSDAAGNYAFDGLPVGAYGVRITAAPSGAVLTGDPDQPDAPCTVCDGRTTAPVLLAPGDVFLNVDFGYQLDAGSAAAIGDTIWVDVDRDNALDAGEPRQPGVTVALLRDLNDDGAWQAGEPVIAVAVTDANGQYAFSGVPAADGTGSDDYLVWVHDTGGILTELVAVYDADGANPAGGLVSGLGISAVSDLAPAGDQDQDFAYAPPGQDAGEALVGDTVWMDLNGNNTLDAGEGLEGIIVELWLDPGAAAFAYAQTNENGQYFFGGQAAGSYIIKLDISSLPNNAINLVNFADPDGGTAHQAAFSLAAGEINLVQDFGYRARTDGDYSRTISGTIWNDVDADGLLDGGETSGYAGVTVALYDDVDNNGTLSTHDERIGVATTDANGDFSFTGLLNSRYFVDVTDEHHVLNGTWHSLGTAGSDNNSQVDFYTIVLAGADNATADFGYYKSPAALGDYVWLDRNNDGVQDADEPGMAGAVVTLSVTYPGGGSASYAILTGFGGAYRFGNLLLDEDTNLADDTAGTPTYALSFTTPPGMTPSPVFVGAADTDSNGLSAVATPLVQGQTDTTYDSGFYVELLDFGDLPAFYPTLFSPGPAHVIFPDTDITPDGLPNTAGLRPAVWLGLTLDLELNGQPGPDADLDGPDEDGLRFSPNGWIPNQSSTLTITLNSDATGVTAYYGLWIDWGDGDDGGPDGDFDAFYSGSGVTHSPVDVPVLVDVPEWYDGYSDVYFRVRVADAPLGEGDYQGTIINGEVEDYLNAFSPTAVQLTELKAQSLPWSTPVAGLLLLAACLGIGAAVPYMKKRS